MSKKQFFIAISSLGLAFFIIFSVVVLPPLFDNPDIIGAFLAGFVNPYSSGYSFDVIITWCILAAWVIYESKRIKYGWLCLVLGIVPGVAVGLAAYLLLRESEVGRKT